jgi:predicted permease
MAKLGEWIRRLDYLLHRSARDAELDAEMAAHREAMHVPSRFGNTLRLGENARDVWGLGPLDDAWRDLQLAARGLARSRGFAFIAIVSLALGLTISAVTLSVVNAYLIQGIPYPDARRLHHVMYAPPGPWEPGGLSAMDWAALNDVVEFPVATQQASLYLTEGSYAQPLRALRVNRGFMGALGVRAALGRAFDDADFTRAGETPIMIGYALWHDRFQSDSAVIGRTIRAETEGRSAGRETFRVIGVLPPGFWFGRESSELVGALVPLAGPARVYMVRLRAGVPPAAAEQRLTQAARAVATTMKPNWTGVHLESVHERYVQSVRPILNGAILAALLVLAIACANVGVLVLLRAMRRQQEMGVRIALGAGHRHILRLLLAETTLLSGVAIVLVVVLTAMLLRALSPFIETQLGRPAPGGPSSIAMNSTVFGAMACVGIAVALTLSFVPLVTPWQRLLARALRQSGRGVSDGRTMQRLRATLIATELAGSLVLLTACGMLLRSVVNMAQTDLGFRVKNLVRASVVVPERSYPDAASRLALYQRISDRASGVTHARVALTTWPPFAENPARPFVTDGGVTDAHGAAVEGVGLDYFDALGISIVEGRAFSAADRVGTEPVMIVSEALAHRLWPNSSAIGHRLQTAENTFGAPEPTTWRTIVGVVRDVRQSYTDTELNDIYFPFFQLAPDRYGTFYLESSLPALAVEQSLRVALAESDPTLVVRGVRSVVDENRSLARSRTLVRALAGVAMLAGVFAMIGLYAVIAFAVQQREREFAIRVALGGSRGAIVSSSMREGTVVLAVGLGAGAAMAAMVERVLRSQLYGVPRFDVMTIGGAALVLGVAGLLAIWLPARGAARVDPRLILTE